MSSRNRSATSSNSGSGRVALTSQSCAQRRSWRSRQPVGRPRLSRFQGRPVDIVQLDEHIDYLEAEVPPRWGRRAQPAARRGRSPRRAPPSRRTGPRGRDRRRTRPARPARALGAPQRELYVRLPCHVVRRRRQGRGGGRRTTTRVSLRSTGNVRFDDPAPIRDARTGLDPIPRSSRKAARATGSRRLVTGPDRRARGRA